MAKGTKFFRIATEGATSDGRVIDRETLVEMA
ncbi:GPO family capsid scaffolding protein, partial [Ralstonia solanacearum]